MTASVQNGEITERRLEPHIVAYHKGNWYVKGVNLADGKVIVLAIFRIQTAKLTERTFEIRKDILKQTEKEGLFDYPKIENIKVKCAPEIAYYLHEQQKAKSPFRWRKTTSAAVRMGFCLLDTVIRCVGEKGVVEQRNLAKHRGKTACKG